MEENTVTTQQGENNTPQTDKTFTQDDVNRIVQERLARVKAEPSEKEADLEKRERDLNSRELKLKVKEVFTDKKLPVELMDVLDYSDESKINDHIKILEKAYNAQPDVKISGGKPAVGYTPPNGNAPHYDKVREAMGLYR